MKQLWSYGMGLGLGLSSVSTALGAPSWFPSGNDSAFPRSSHVVGVGACGPEVSPANRPACAGQRALEKVASILRTHIDVERRRTTHSELTATDTKKPQQRTSTQIDHMGRERTSIDLQAAEPVRGECNVSERTCYAMVVLERRAAALRWLRQHRELGAEIAGLLGNLEQRPRLEQLRRLVRARRLAARQDQIADLIDSIDGGVRTPAASSPKVSLAAEKTLRSLAICFQAQGPADPSRVFARIRSALQILPPQKIIIAGPKGCGEAPEAPVVVTAEVDFEPVRRVMGSLRVIDARARLTVSENGRCAATSSSLLGHGVARTEELARDAALDQLAESVGQEALRLLMEDA